MPQVPIDPSRTALIFFDMLNCYIHPPDAEKERRILATGVMDRCVEMERAARAAGIPIFYTNGAHRPDSKDYAPTLSDADMELVPWPEGPRLMRGGVAVAGTPAGDVIPELAPEPGDWVIGKPRWSSFVGTSLDPVLRGIGVDTVLLAGGSTDVGIIATAYSARDLGYHLIVLRDACQSQRPGAQDFCMDRLFPRMARVMTVAQACSLLPGGRP
ncbi:MAG TPA: cysteine hydrolase [Chloroflexota bacterium]|jgi:nicotinamidase-related amidase